MFFFQFGFKLNIIIDCLPLATNQSQFPQWQINPCIPVTCSCDQLSMGETGDYSGAKYDGDFSISLEKAQHNKHRFIADSLNVREGSRVLDMACGWGPFSNYLVKERGAESLGLTLSEGQAKACQDNGLNVIVRDCRYVKAEDFGTFDAIACIGGLEHFCLLVVSPGCIARRPPV